MDKEGDNFYTTWYVAINITESQSGYATATSVGDCCVYFLQN